ncbi:MAG: hypothetical protein U5K43_00035 [Halofilum sp. (in: g-proteobacteria)]|nr:hypothetical protein [Halofilum sp. (in: g-proteobacteria)]
MSARAGTVAIARGLRWCLFGLVLGLASVALAWRMLAVDFAYPVLYDLLDIGATIERYGPENEVRPGFQRTARGERERVFGAIVDAIATRAAVSRRSATWHRTAGPSGAC